MGLARVEPLEFFTVDALKAGWYLTWRLWLRLVGVGVVFGVLGAVAIPLLGVSVGRGASAFRGGTAVAAVLLILLVVAVWVYVWITFTNRIATSWAEKRYGRALPKGVWWGITWRSFLVGVAMSVGIGVAQILFSGAYALIGNIASFGLGIANIVVTLQATGWAMSVMVAKRLEGVAVPIGAATAAAIAQPVARTSAPVTVTAEGRVQCPKCGGYETEKGALIGWHCQVCGWWESRG